MIGGLLLAALAVPAPSAAAVAPSAPPAAAPAGQRVVKLSPQGSEVVKQWSTQGDPGLQMLVQQQRELRTQMLALIGAPKIDVAKLEALMKKQEGLQSDIRQRSDARLLALVKALPEADRSLFLKSLQRPVVPPPVVPPSPQPAQ